MKYGKIFRIGRTVDETGKRENGNRPVGEVSNRRTGRLDQERCNLIDWTILRAGLNYSRRQRAASERYWQNRARNVV